VRRLLEDIDVLRNKTTPSRLIVQKVLRNADTSSGQQRHFEIQALEMLPPCNRIVQMLDCVHRYPDPDHCAAFFEYYPLGDVYHWKEAMFDKKNHKPVPESYIWRFFIQMAQAILFIQGGPGPDQDRREPIVHRDIKPKNVLVVDNGSTYPSFKLHDFGCATIRKPGKEYKESYCGTFEWQPPEVSDRSKSDD
jgi:serine/threonine protein kinase